MCYTSMDLTRQALQTFFFSNLGFMRRNRTFSPYVILMLRSVSGATYLRKKRKLQLVNLLSSVQKKTRSIEKFSKIYLAIFLSDRENFSFKLVPIHNIEYI